MDSKSIRYCIWNNKGGVGKTFLTYCLSIEYAIQHPQKRVVVIDMCPQANVSEMLLGGNGIGEERLASCCDNGKTIA
ncbi:MAG: ParA family protein, partial [Planctomycetaceae bacterium]|nr:ParA family protein [Planctomycetaceae bacterium]